MKEVYKTLTDDEYKVLSKVARKTGCDCWFIIKQDCHGVDYVYDLEERKRMCLKTGVGMLSDSIDCQENFDNCRLDNDERKTLWDLFEKLNVKMNTSVHWEL